MRILGVSAYFHDASAALIEDGVLVAAAEEERFTRVKHDFSFPEHAIQFCLDHAGIEGRDLDYVVFFEKPFVKFERLFKTAVAAFPWSYPAFSQSMRAWIFDKLWVRNHIRQTIGVDNKKILFSEHHLSHAASAYFCSPFDAAGILTFDGVGEWATTTMGYGRGRDLRITRELRFPHSIGLLYSAFTAFLGFEVNEGEYKVMGMAPYGSPRFVEKIWRVVNQAGDGSLWLDLDYFSFHRSTKNSFSRKFIDLFGEPRDPSLPFFTEGTGYPSYHGDRPHNYDQMLTYNQHYADVAASIQAVTEDIVLKLAQQVHETTGLTDLCMAGGVALNSVANARILRETPIERLYIQPSAGDGGGAVGAALYAWHCALGNEGRFVMEHAYWGKEYGADEVLEAIDRAGLQSRQVNDPSSLIEMTVDRLVDGKVVGWFQGRFEWGPRALGNRSILADPRRSEMKDIVNGMIKFREPFRPFAPSVISQAASEYFETSGADSMPERFMLLVVPVRDSVQSKIPAVNHMGTARLQVVHRETNPYYYDLISMFGQATGIPVVLNTSFNVRGEPIVTSPDDAIRTFMNSGIQSMVIGDHLIDKR